LTEFGTQAGNLRSGAYKSKLNGLLSKQINMWLHLLIIDTVGVAPGFNCLDWLNWNCVGNIGEQ